MTNRWKTEFDNHHIHKTISTIQDVLDNIGKKDLDEDTQAEFDRIIYVFNLIKASINSSDSYLMPIAYLNTMHSALVHANFQNQLNAYKNSNQGINYLRNANNHISNYITQIISFTQIGDFSENYKPVENLQNESESAIKLLRKQKAEVEAQFKDLKNKLKEADDDIEATKKNNVEITSSYQKDFLESQTSRQNDYNNIKTKLENQSEEELRIAKNEIRDFYKSQKKKLTELMASSESKYNKILELYELSASDSVGGGYSQVSSNAESESKFWNKVFYGFVIATALWAGITYFYSLSLNNNIGFDIREIIKAVPVTLILLYGAVYSSRQSKRLTDFSQKAKWLALELKALNPFLSELKEEDAQKLRYDLSSKFFGSNYELDKAEDENLTIKVEKGALSKFITSVRDIFK